MSKQKPLLLKNGEYTVHYTVPRDSGGVRYTELFYTVSADGGTTERLRQPLQMKLSGNSEADRIRFEFKLEEKYAALCGRISKLEHPFDSNAVTFAAFALDPVHRQSIINMFRWHNSTYKSYTSSIRRLLAKHLPPNKSLARLTETDFKHAVSAACESWSKKPRRGSIKPEDYQRSCWNIFSKFMTFAEAKVPGVTNPLRGKRLDFGSESTGARSERTPDHVKWAIDRRFSQKALTLENERNLFNLTFQSLDEDKVLGIALMWLAGLRPAEACAIRYKNVGRYLVDGEKYISVLQVLGQVKGTRMLCISPDTKTHNAARQIPLSPILRYLIDRKEYHIYPKYSKEEIENMPLVYDGDPKNLCDPKNLSEYIKDKLVRIGITKDFLGSDILDSDNEAGSIRAYMLRYTFDTCMAAYDMPEDQQDYLMGHSLRQQDAGYKARRQSDYVVPNIQYEMYSVIRQHDLELLEGMPDTPVISGIQKIIENTEAISEDYRAKIIQYHKNIRGGVTEEMRRKHTEKE